ncbi:hypothetical protein GNS53_18675 [Vibrio cholerae]|nr:hypothetical protein [Vibrio cholerae]EGQ8651195.1 hypothetical protein [Vibrio cholerae]PKQ52216.1 hypothetical protein CR151_16585 [Vibrio cholerae]
MSEISNSEAATQPLSNVTPLPKSDKPSLIVAMAAKYGVDPKKFWDTLKATAFRQRNGDAPTDEQMMALLVVANPTFSSDGSLMVNGKAIMTKQ